MPTALPNRQVLEPRLPWADSARLLILVARLRFLDFWMHVVVRRGSALADDRLLRRILRWLTLHYAIGALLPGAPEPEHGAKVRAILCSRRYIGSTTHPRPPE